MNFEQLYPYVAKTWHPTKNGDLKFSEITSLHSDKRVWWKCERGHEWQAEVRTRFRQKSKCFFCSGFKASKENNISVTHPHLIEEWNFEKNINLKPSDFVKNSHRKVWWKCERGHEWQAQIVSRARDERGCRLCCSGIKISRLELRIVAELKIMFGDVQHSVILGKEIDVFLPGMKIGIEVDGRIWHENKFERDLEKNLFFKRKNIEIIRLREHGLPIIGPLDIHYKNGDELNSIKKLVSNIYEFKKLENNLYKDTTAFLNNKEYFSLCRSIKVVPKKLSFGYKFPNLAKTWHPTKNGDLTPFDVRFGSKEEYWWRCCNGHEWVRSVERRGRNKNCPYCSGQLVSMENNLINRHPHIASEWHPTKNGMLKPSDIHFGAHRIVYWKCKAGHEWKSSVRDRTRFSRGCRQCKKKTE